MMSLEKQLAKTVVRQQESLDGVLRRISTLADEIAILRNELQRFKSAVADDVKYLTKRVED